MNIIEKAKSRRAEFDALIEKSNDADALVEELEKVKDKLSASAKAALDKHQKKKAGKKND